MDKELGKKLEDFFKHYPEIKLVYFFGSRAVDQGGPVSDYDFAFYADEPDSKKIFDLKLKLMDNLSRAFGTDKVDVVALNIVESPELKYHIISEGELIYEKEPFRVLVEPRILSVYFDFRDFLLRHNLTRAS